MERAEKAVVDASVVIKWFNPEEFSKEALALRKLHIEGTCHLTSPSLMPLEVINALRYNPQIGVKVLEDVAHDLYDLQIALAELDGESLGFAVRVAYRHGITLYDATYVSLAERLGCDLYTADERLIEAVGTPPATHIKELRSRGR